MALATTESIMAIEKSNESLARHIEKQMYWGITSASAARTALHLSNQEWPSRWTPEKTPLEWLESRLYSVKERAWT